MSRLGFFPRLLLAFFLVIIVAGVVLYLVGSALAPSLLQAHLESMGITHHNIPIGTSLMLTDLEVGYKSALTKSLLWAVVAALLIGGGLSLYITSQVAGPLGRMRGATRRIAKGEYSERVRYAGPGEISDLVADFNMMAEALEASETQRSDLIRNLAHEFRTPLMNLRGYIEGVEDGVFQFDEETIGATKRQLERMERLMNDLSLLSRVDAGRESVQPERVGLESICQAAINTVRPQFVQKGVGLRCEPIPPDLFVLADPIRTEQVLTNLLINALRHTPAEGEVVLWATRGTDQATMHVRDTGEGISEEALPHIFKRFYRGNGKNATAGSGIGLTIAQYFVEAQGGSLKAESELGKGSHFWFTLPKA